MNSEQREQIDRCFEQLVKEDPLLQEAFAKNLASPDRLFIMNLESVQGHERDVMFLSMTYGHQSPEIRSTRGSDQSIPTRAGVV